MRIKILCSDKIANDSHRSREEYIDVAPNDTIANAKVKCSLIYENINIDEFDITLDHVVLKDEVIVSDILKTRRSEGEITFVLKPREAFCCVLF